MIVVDASAMVAVVLRSPAAKAVESRIFAAGQSLHAPYLIDVEVAQVVRRWTLRGDIDPARGALALSDFSDFTLTRYPHDWLLIRVWELRGNISAYDAVYVALAESLNAPLLTCDRKLAASSGHGARIEAV